MDKYIDALVSAIREARLEFFMNSTDDELEECLFAVEELSGSNDFSVGDPFESPLVDFHPNTVRMVEKNDDLYLGYRANHFVLIFGYSEFPTFEDCVVCLANHKGGLCITVFKFKDLSSL